MMFIRIGITLVAFLACEANAAVVPFRPPFAKQVTFSPYQVVAGTQVKIGCILGAKPQLQIDTNTPLGDYMAHHKPSWTLPLEIIVDGTVIHTSDESGMASDASEVTESKDWVVPASYAGKKLHVECAIDRAKKMLPSSASGTLTILAEPLPKLKMKDQRDHNVAEPPGGLILPPAAAGKAAGSDLPVTQLKLPDITSRPMVGIAGRPVPWGGTAAIKSNQARSQANGRCLVAFEHFVHNAGATATGTFRRRWRNDATNGSASGAYQPVAAAQFVRRIDTLELLPGTNHLRLALDSMSQVAEGDESNNLFEVTVQLAGDCGSAQTATPLGTEIEKILN
jgi:hypothetical protein